MRHRSRAQAIGLFAVMLLAIMGALAVVIDMGAFFLLQRQMQSAADAAALAAVWYTPVCDPAGAGCQDGSAISVTASSCTGPRDFNTDGIDDRDGVPCQVAYNFATLNLGPFGGLCRSGSTDVQSHPDHLHGINMYLVTVRCDAFHWIGTIVPGVPATALVGANAGAAIGWRNANGELTATNNSNPYISRLIWTPS